MTTWIEEGSAASSWLTDAVIGARFRFTMCELLSGFAPLTLCNWAGTFGNAIMCDFAVTDAWSMESTASSTWVEES